MLVEQLRHGLHAPFPSPTPRFRADDLFLAHPVFAYFPHPSTPQAACPRGFSLPAPAFAGVTVLRRDKFAPMAWHRRTARGHRVPPRQREEAVQGGIAAPCPAARSVTADHPSGRGVASVHGRNDVRPPIGGRSQLFRNDVRRRRRTRGEAFRPWPVGNLSGHEPPLDLRRERAFRRRPTP